MTDRGLPRSAKKRAAARAASLAPSGFTNSKKRQTRKVSRARTTLTGSSRASVTDLTELFVFGIALGSERRRPCLVLKDGKGSESLAVWLNPIDAAHALEDVAHAAASAHNVTRQLLKNFGLSLDRCVFTEVRGHHQYARLHFAQSLGDAQNGSCSVPTIDVRADEAMSLCLSLSARFFAPPEFIARCRDVDAEMMSIENAVAAKPEILSKPHRYMM